MQKGKGIQAQPSGAPGSSNFQGWQTNKTAAGHQKVCRHYQSSSEVPSAGRPTIHLCLVKGAANHVHVVLRPIQNSTASGLMPSLLHTLSKDAKIGYWIYQNCLLNAFCCMKASRLQCVQHVMPNAEVLLDKQSYPCWTQHNHTSHSADDFWVTAFPEGKSSGLRKLWQLCEQQDTAEIICPRLKVSHDQFFTNGQSFSQNLAKCPDLLNV